MLILNILEFSQIKYQNLAPAVRINEIARREGNLYSEQDWAVLLPMLNR